MKKIILLAFFVAFLVPAKSQLIDWGKVLKNDTIFTATMTGTSETVAKRLRAPNGALIWYEFPSFATNSTAQIACGESVDGEHFQLPVALTALIPLTSASIVYFEGDSVMGQTVRADNIVGQYWVTTLYKGNSTADTLIIHYSK